MKRSDVLFWGAVVMLCAGVFSGCREEHSPDQLSAPAAPLYALDESRPAISGENAYVHVENLVKMGTRTPGSPGLEESLKYIEKYLARYGWKTERQSFAQETPAGRKSFTNLRARFGEHADFGSPASGIVGGHIDTKVFDFSFVGANDGASHTAVLLELARLAKAEPALFQGVELVFFDGEEAFGPHMDGVTDGLFGSSHYVKNLSALPRWMVNVDMVGAKRLRIRIPADTPQNLYSLYRKAVSERRENEDTFGVAEGIILDDHIPFQDKGVPAINLIGEFQDGDWWHTPKDTLDLIGASSLERSGKFLQVLLKNIREAESSQ